MKEAAILQKEGETKNLNILDRSLLNFKESENFVDRCFSK